jgi:hypothetical protein
VGRGNVGLSIVEGFQSRVRNDAMCATAQRAVAVNVEFPLCLNMEIRSEPIAQNDALIAISIESVKQRDGRACEATSASQLIHSKSLNAMVGSAIYAVSERLNGCVGLTLTAHQSLITSCRLPLAATIPSTT